MNHIQFLITILFFLGTFIFPNITNAILPLTGDIKTLHDPVVMKENGIYYVFTTGKGIRLTVSMDMKDWVSKGFIFEPLPKWTYDINPQLVDLWAPDISFFNGKYHLYYAASVFGKNQSAIGLATNKTLNPDSPDYDWKDEGIVIQSRPGIDDWNAIDPNIIFDEKKEPWMAFGSYWSGIKLHKIDIETGKFSTVDTTLYSLASRPGNTAIEAPFIIYRNGYYYLFVSFDYCCRGKNSNYNVRVGRSKKLTGTYFDKDNRAMLDGGGTLVVESKGRWRGPGHCSILREKNQYYLFYHAYDAEENGIQNLRINPIQWDTEGWPVVKGP